MARPNRAAFRAMLWEYLGHPDDETAERRRMLYAIVILRLGLGLIFLLRGLAAAFATSGEAIAMRLGDPARLGLHGAAADTLLFLLGCTEIAVGVLLITGAFTRVGAVVGGVLTGLYCALGSYPWFGDGDCDAAGACLSLLRASSGIQAQAACFALLGGLVLLVLCGSPFLGADRALDKLEEEERDRAPAVLPRQATATPLSLRAGLAGGAAWLAYRAWGAALPGVWLLLIGALVVAVPLLFGLGVRPLAGVVLLLTVPSLALGVDQWRATGWTIWAVPAVALALIVSGPGTLSLAHRLSIGQSRVQATNGA